MSGWLGDGCVNGWVLGAPATAYDARPVGVCGPQHVENTFAPSIHSTASTVQRLVVFVHDNAHPSEFYKPSKCHNNMIAVWRSNGRYNNFAPSINLTVTVDCAKLGSVCSVAITMENKFSSSINSTATVDLAKLGSVCA